MKRIVLALGGNAILTSNDTVGYKVQKENIEKTAKSLVNLIKKGYEVVLTHGNGPQVGHLLLQQEEANAGGDLFPLDALTAETQGWIGYLLAQSIKNELLKEKINKEVLTIITQVEVDEKDEAFQSPTKPIGSFYSEKEAIELISNNDWKMIEDAGRGWRRVVPSPNPIKIRESNSIKYLLDQEIFVIASGGGGIPVAKTKNGYKGVEAVIDKDRSASLLAKEVEAELFMILTDVPFAYINYNKENEQALETMNVEEMEELLKAGEFKTGSMAPKVEACISFTKETGKPSFITSLDKVEEALEGKSGTEIYS